MSQRQINTKPVTTLARRYSQLAHAYPFVPAAIAPTLLTVLGISVLGLRPESGESPVGFWIAMILYGVVLATKFVLDAANTRKFNNTAKRLASLQFQILHLDQVIKTKCANMIEATKTSDNPQELLKRAKGKLGFDRSITVLNKELAETVINYLQSIGRGIDAEFVAKVIIPDNNGEFIVQGNWYKTGGTRTPNRNTGLKISMDNCVASRLWHDRGKNVESHSDVEVAEKDGKFVYVHEGQRQNLKSIFCYQISDEDTGEPIAIWSIDADKIGVFPNGRDEIQDELVRIFTSFALRVTLERTYSYILDVAEPILASAIKQHEKQKGGDNNGK